VLLAGRYSNDSAMWMVIAGLAALVGHCFPVWLKFKGGKGVATGGRGISRALSSRVSRRAHSVFIGRRLLALRFARLRCGRRGDAAADVFFFGRRIMLRRWSSRLERLPWRCSSSTSMMEILQRLVQGTEPKFSFAGKTLSDQDSPFSGGKLGHGAGDCFFAQRAET